MKTVVVNVEDVYPDENNPRADFGDLDALAASFALNSERPGEPFAPPLLLADGGIYRIVDGERRYRAMRKAGTRRFTANVADSMDEANVLAAMLATDDKAALSDEERSRGVQTALLLGMRPDDVDTAARLKRGTASRVRRAAEAVGEDATQMTIDRLLAVDEFAGMGDDKTAKKLAECDEREWERIAEDARRTAANKAKAEAICAALREAGAVEMDKRQHSERFSAWRCVGSVPSAKKAAAMCEGKEGLTYTCDVSTWGASVYLYEPRPEEGVDPEQDEARKVAGRVDEAAASYGSRLFQWFEGLRCKASAAAAVKAMAERRFADRFDDELGEYAEAAGCGTPLDGEPGEWALAIGLAGLYEDWSRCSHSIAHMSLGGWRAGAYERALELYEAAKSDGFPATDEDEWLHDMARKALKGGEAND